MNINEHTPKCAHDLFSLNFLRTYADCILTTGMILRKEPDAFEPTLPLQLGFPQEVYYRTNNAVKGKPIAILTKDVRLNLHSDTINQVYNSNLFRKHILTRPESLDRFNSWDKTYDMDFEASKITLDGVENLSMDSAIQHLQREYQYKQILVEAGLSTTAPFYKRQIALSEDEPGLKVEEMTP